jgi:hypothetical protein
MVNVATTRATPANRIRACWKASWSSPWGLLFHLASQLGTGQRTSSAWLTPGSAATTMLVALPGPGRSTSSANSAVKPA